MGFKTVVERVWKRNAALGTPEEVPKFADGDTEALDRVLYLWQGVLDDFFVASHGFCCRACWPILATDSPDSRAVGRLARMHIVVLPCTTVGVDISLASK